MLRKLVFYFLIYFAIAGLSACSKPVPLKLSGDLQNYIGVWQFRFEDFQKNEIKVNNLLLVLNENGSGQYKKCFLHVTKSSHSNKTFRISIDYPEAIVTRIEKGKLSLSQKLGWFDFDSDLTINNGPYVENEQWYLEIEGTKLSKIAAEDIDSKTHWACPSDESSDSDA